jgi:large subunit ribosomal protein L7/L12
MSSKANKLVEEIGSMTVLELADLVKAIETTFGVSAAMPVAAAASNEAAAPVEEAKSEYKVTLKEAGDKKIDVIKALRKVTELNLTDAKKAVDEAPTVIAENADKKKAGEMKEALEAAGAKVELS